MVAIAIYLAIRHGRRIAAQALALPMSTVYRWWTDYRRAPGQYAEAARLERANGLHDLLVACEAHGFDVRRNVTMLEPLKIMQSGPAIDAFRSAADLSEESTCGLKGCPMDLLNRRSEK